MKNYPTLVHSPERDKALPEYTIWAQFVVSDYGDRDLTVEILSPLPEDSWLWDEDLEMILFGVPWVQVDSGEGWVFSIASADRSIRMGIAPEQPFAVRVGVEYSWDSWNNEGDADYSATVVAVEPLSPQEQAERVADWLAQFEAYKAEAVAEMRALHELRRTDVSAMEVREDEIWPDGYIGRRTIARLQLWSKHGDLKKSRKYASSPLIEVRNETGDWKEARSRFRERVAAELPHVDLDALTSRRRRC